MKLLFAPLLSLFLGSCQPVLKTIYGAGKPGVQRPEKINRWLNREGLHPQHLAAVRPQAFHNVFMKYADGLKVFSADGRFIPLGYRGGKFCPQGLEEVLASLNPQPAYPVTAAYTLLFNQVASFKAGPLSLNTLFKELRTLQGDVIPSSREKVDYFVLIPFALWIGRRFQTKDIRSFVKAMSRNPHARFSIWYINLDKHAWWGEEWNARIILQ